MENRDTCGDRLDKDLKKMQDAIHQGALFIVGNSKDITALQEWQVRQNGTLREIDKSLKDIKEKVGCIQSEDISALRLDIAKGKPSWATLILITFLSSVAVGAVVFALKIAIP